MFIFPVHRFNPQTVTAAPRALTLTGGTSISGDEDFIVTDGGGRWTIEFGGIQLNTPALERAWSAWMAYLDEGAVPCLVPTVTLRTAPRPMVHKSPMRPPKLDDGGSWFAETVDMAAPYIVASFAADAPLRATSVALDVTKGGDLIGGETFSVSDRAYRLVRETAPGVFDIRPPLRVAVEAGDAVNFNWPVVKCRLEPTDPAPTMYASKNGEVSIRFVEYMR